MEPLLVLIVSVLNEANTTLARNFRNLERGLSWVYQKSYHGVIRGLSGLSYEWISREQYRVIQGLSGVMYLATSCINTFCISLWIILAKAGSYLNISEHDMRHDITVTWERDTHTYPKQNKKHIYTYTHQANIWTHINTYSIYNHILPYHTILTLPTKGFTQVSEEKRWVCMCVCVWVKRVSQEVGGYHLEVGFRMFRRFRKFRRFSRF